MKFLLLAEQEFGVPGCIRLRGSHGRPDLFQHLVTSDATNVRREAHRTTAEAAMLPVSNCVVPANIA